MKFGMERPISRRFRAFCEGSNFFRMLVMVSGVRVSMKSSMTVPAGGRSLRMVSDVAIDVCTGFVRGVADVEADQNLLRPCAAEFLFQGEVGVHIDLCGLAGISFLLAQEGWTRCYRGWRRFAAESLLLLSLVMLLF